MYIAPNFGIKLGVQVAQILVTILWVTSIDLIMGAGLGPPGEMFLYYLIQYDEILSLLVI